MERLPLDRSVLDSALERMDIADIAQATIRQSGDIARILENETGTEFLHLEMGVPGLPPEQVGVEAECKALRQGVASQYPSMSGIPELKEQASRFIRAFLDIGVAPQGCIPTVGSMQGSFTLFLLCSQLDPKKNKILFIDPGFPVQRNQVHILNIPHASFDIYEYRAEKLGPKLESYLTQGDVAAIVYSNPNNPAWICLTEEELRTVGELASRYDAIVIEDLAYLCMDFRKPLGRPFEAPYQSSVARYTQNYILMISGSKIFSYAGQRIAVAAISDTLYTRQYPALRERYGMARLGDAYVLTILYAASSGTREPFSPVRPRGHVPRRGRRPAGFRGRNVGIRTPRTADQGAVPAPRFPHRLRQGSGRGGKRRILLHGRLRRSDQLGAAERTAALRHLRHFAHHDRQPPAGHPRLRLAAQPPRTVRPLGSQTNRLRAKPPISLCNSRQPPKPQSSSDRTAASTFRAAPRFPKCWSKP